MKKAITIVLMVGMNLNAFASEIWVTTPNLSTKEKLEKLAEARRERVKETDFISVFDALLARPILPEVQAEFLQLEEAAQTAELDGKFENAMRLYKQLLQKTINVPNASGVERITFSCLVHIAELSDVIKSPEAAARWRQAHAWNPRPLSRESEFSPQIVQKFNSLRIERIQGQVEVTSPAEAWVYVDGKRIRLNGGVFKESIEPGEHQVAVLVPGSDWLYKNIVIRDGQTLEVSFHPEPLVEGDCDNPHFIGAGLPTKAKLLVAFDESCDRIYYDKAWFSIAGRRIEGLVHTATTANSLMNQLVAPREEKSWWERASHSGWFWAGIGAVIVGGITLAVQSQNQQTSVIPTQVVRQ